MAYLSVEPLNQTGLEPEREQEWETLDRLGRMVREAVDHPVNARWRIYAEKAFRYEEGDQLDAQMLEELRQRGQPPLVENRIGKQRRTFMGLYERLRMKAAFTGRNQPMDELTAHAFNDLNRYVDQQSGFADEEALAVKDHWIAGMGWLEKAVEYERDGRPRLYTMHEDPFYMWPDPFGRRRDLQDYRYVIRSKWLDLDVAMAFFPKKKEALQLCVNREHHSVSGLIKIHDPSWVWENEWSWVDQRRKRVRLAEVWYRRKAQRMATRTEDGMQIILDMAGERAVKQAAKSQKLDTYTTTVDEMHVGIFCGDALLFHDVSPYNHRQFPFVLYLYNRKKNGMPVGWVSEDIMTLQDGHNKRHSKALHLLTTRQVITTDHATDMSDDELMTEVAKGDGLIKLHQGRRIEDHFQIRENIDMGQAQLALYAHVRQSFDDAGGVSEVQQGAAPGDVRSDRGLARLEANAIGLDAEIFRQIKMARRQGLLLQTSNIQQFFTDQMLFQVTEDEKTVRTIQLYPRDFAHLRRFYVDLAMIDVGDSATSRQHQLETLFQALPSVLQFGPGWAGVLLEMTDLKDKEKIMQMVAQMGKPAPEEPKVSLSMKWEEMKTFEKAMFAARFGMQELAQMLMQSEELTNTEKTLLNQQLIQQSKERMANKRIDTKMLELDLKQDELGRKTGLDAMKTAVQEETKRVVAERQAEAKAKTPKPKA